MGEGAASQTREPVVTNHSPTPPTAQRQVVGLAVPVIGENVLQTAVRVVHTMIVAAFGTEALIGVGIASEIILFLFPFTREFAVGCTAIVSRAIGAHGQGGANRLARQTTRWALSAVTPLSLLEDALTPTLRGIFRPLPDVATDATTCLRITSAQLAVTLLTSIFGAVVRGAGNNRTPLYASARAGT
jgi:multidrug resistance protein, MATE family